MIPTWPATLPAHFERQGYTTRRGDGRLRSETTTGPGKVRLRSRAVSDPLVGRMRMTGAQLDIFEAFLSDQIAEGALPFLFPDPRGGLDILVHVGEEMPAVSNVAGDVWEVALQLERIRTGSLQPGLPTLPAGYAYVVRDGAYVVYDRRAVVVRVPS